MVSIFISIGIPAEQKRDITELKVQLPIVFKEVYSSVTMLMFSGWKLIPQISLLLKHLLKAFMLTNHMFYSLIISHPALTGTPRI